MSQMERIQAEYVDFTRRPFDNLGKESVEEHSALSQLFEAVLRLFSLALQQCTTAFRSGAAEYALPEELRRMREELLQSAPGTSYSCMLLSEWLSDDAYAEDQEP